MPDQPSIKVIKRFTYRDAPEEWSNQYHFSGGDPEDDSAWLAIGNAIANGEAAFLGSGVAAVKYLGYEAGNEISVWQYDLVTDAAPIYGTQSITHAVPGDCAAWIRYRRAGLSSTAKRVYCRNYYHGVKGQDTDAVPVAIQALMHTFGLGMITDLLPEERVIVAPQGAELSFPLASEWFTTRTLRRRGRRPT